MPMRDLRPLLWLRWRQFRDSAIYWMRVAGYDSEHAGSLSQRLYIVYLLAIGGVWLFAMWAWGYQHASQLGAILAPDTMTWILTAFPWLMLVIQVIVLAGALRSTPLKLSFADMAYIAASPAARSAPVLLGFIQQLITRTLLIGVLVSLFAALLIHPIDSRMAGAASLRALAASLPLIVFTWGLAWLLGIFRLVFPQLGRLRFLWLTPTLLIGLAYLLPDAFLWPGRSLILAIYGEQPLWTVAFMTAVALLLVVTFVALGNRINMIHACDESIMYARIQALGLMAWRQPGLQVRVRLQAAQASRKPLLYLPHARGWRGFFAKAVLSYIRHPFMLLTCLLWGIAMTQLGVVIVANRLPPQFWIGWVLLAGIAPPFGLLHVFSADVQERFLRQFLRVDGMQLLTADVILPLTFMVGGALGVWVLQGFPEETTSYGMMMIPILAVLVTLSGAFSLTRSRVVQTRILATAGSLGAVILAGIALSTPIASLSAAIIAAMILSSLVAQDA